MSLLTALVLSAQASYAKMQMDLTVAPSQEFNNSTATFTVHIYDPDHADWKFKRAYVILYVTYPSEHDGHIAGYSHFYTGADGRYDFTYEPVMAGTYNVRASCTFNYTDAGFSNEGQQSVRTSDVPFTAIKDSTSESGFTVSVANGAASSSSSDASASNGTLPCGIGLIIPLLLVGIVTLVGVATKRNGK